MNDREYGGQMGELSRQELIPRFVGKQRGQGNVADGLRADLPVPALSGLPIGQILTHLGKLRQEDIEKVLTLQEKELKPFGQTAVSHNLIVEADLQQALAIQFGYPFVRPDADYFREDLRAAYDPFSEHVDALRLLRGTLLSRWLDAHNKIVGIISPRRAEGRSYLTANLAVVFAQLGYRTLLVDADLRFPSQHKIFKSPNQAGLSSLLAKRILPKDIIRTVPVFSSLRLLVSGPATPNPADLMSSPMLSLVLRKLKQRFDVILVDTPCNLYPEVMNVVSNVDRTLMVMRKHHTSVGAAQEVEARFSGVNGKLVGCVLSAF